MYHDQEALYYKAWRRLPERFRKPNNLNLYYVLYGGYGEIEAGFQGIKNSRNIDQATGETLDKLGENVGQFRLGEEDDLYRLLIKTRIIANMSIGDIPTINYVMSVLLKEVFLGLEETWPYEDYLHEPAAIKLKLGPLAGSIPYEIIDRIKAAGVRVLIELNYHQELELETRQGDHSWPLWKCGEHKTGMLPRPIFRGEREIIHLDLETGEYTGKEYKYWKGIKAGDRVFSQSDDVVLRQLSPLDGSFKKAKIYELEEE